MTRAVPAVLAAIVVLSVSFGGGYGTVAFFSDETTVSGEFTAADGFHEEVTGVDVVAPDDADRGGDESVQAEPVADGTGSSVGNGTDRAADGEMPSDPDEPPQPAVGNESPAGSPTENVTDGEPSPEPIVPDDGSDPAHSEHEASDDADDADSDGSSDGVDDRDGHGVDDDRTDEAESTERETGSAGNDETDGEETDGEETTGVGDDE